MKRTLDVYLHRDLVGKLVQDEQGVMRFAYVPEWLHHPGAIPLSHSLPLTEKRFGRNEARAFFAGVLPEQHQREVIAKNLGISAKNDFAMLDKIGGECAGAVTFLPEGEALPKREDSYRLLLPAALGEILRTLPRRPLLAGEEGVRLSLAGAQDKVAVHVSGDGISIPLAGAPSTHILKPSIERFEGVVFNEAFCMRLARAVGINAAHVETRKVADIDFLLVERYDRTFKRDEKTGAEILTRLHQEDFCQAAGIVPEKKYQIEGGPALKDCFALVREVSSAPVLDLNALLDAVIFNLLIGNNDAHGKNFSLLYNGGQTRLALLYDLLSTVYYPELSSKMAMKIGGEFDAKKVRPQDFERMAEESGLAKPMVRRRVLELSELVLSKFPTVAMDHSTAIGVSRLIEANCSRMMQK
ncbi:MAG: type II toxin-antitoxin system HipA family toxin [Chthoniobacteraceae bacterium]|jgi:serine/threonine-protein kinase HipA